MHIFLCVKLDLKIQKFWSDNEATNTTCFLTQANLWNDKWNDKVLHV